MDAFIGLDNPYFRPEILPGIALPKAIFVPSGDHRGTLSQTLGVSVIRRIRRHPSS